MQRSFTISDGCGRPLQTSDSSSNYCDNQSLATQLSSLCMGVTEEFEKRIVHLIPRTFTPSADHTAGVALASWL